MPSGIPMTEQQIAEITIRYSAGESTRSIAAHFEICDRSVVQIARRGGAEARIRGRRDDTPRSVPIPCGWIVSSSDGEMVSGIHRTEEEGRRALASRNARMELEGCSPATLFGLIPIAVSDAGAHCEHAGGAA